MVHLDHWRRMDRYCSNLGCVLLVMDQHKLKQQACHWYRWRSMVPIQIDHRSQFEYKLDFPKHRILVVLRSQLLVHIHMELREQVKHQQIQRFGK